MARTRPPYAQEFRQQIIDLLHSGRIPDELTKEFEPSGQTIRTSVAQADRNAWRRTDGAPSDERKELARLKRENKRLREERQTL